MDSQRGGNVCFYPVDPRAMEISRGPAPLKKDNLPRQKGRGTSTYVMRGCCLLWLGSMRRFLHEVVSSVGGVNLGSSGGCSWAWCRSSMSSENFCYFLLVNYGTIEELPKALPYTASRSAFNQPWATASCELPGTCCVLIGRLRTWRLLEAD